MMTSVRQDAAADGWLVGRKRRRAEGRRQGGDRRHTRLQLQSGARAALQALMG